MATIINNNLVADEAKLRINNPITYIPDPEKSGALGLASLYFGEEGTDPTLPENQKRVYAIQEDGSAVPISQPVMTSAGGVPVYNGSYVQLAIVGAYSLEVRDSNGQQAYYFPAVENEIGLQVGLGGVVEDIITLASSQTVVVFPNVDLGQSIIDIDGVTVDSRSLFRDIDYTITDGANGELTLTTVYPAGTLIRARQNVTTAQQSKLSAVNTLYTIDTIAAAKLIDFNLNDTCALLGESSVTDGLGGDKYLCVAASTGTADDVNFINLDNGLQLQLLSCSYKFKKYTEVVGQAIIASGVLTIDANQGPVQEVTLTENVSSIILGNLTQSGSTTIQLYIKQDGTGGRTVSFSGLFGAGGLAPAVSVDPDAEDCFVFQSRNGSDVYVYTSGQDFGVIS